MRHAIRRFNVFKQRVEYGEVTLRHVRDAANASDYLPDQVCGCKEDEILRRLRDQPLARRKDSHYTMNYESHYDDISVHAMSGGVLAVARRETA